MDQETLNLFMESANELLVEMEEVILILKDFPEDLTEINRLFRVMHSLKGSAAMIDLHEVAEFAHKLESECEYFRQGKASITSEFLKAILKAHDQIKSLIYSQFGGEKADTSLSESIIQEVRRHRMNTLEGSNGFEKEEERLLLQLAYMKGLLNEIKIISIREVCILSEELTKFFALARQLKKESLSEFLHPFENFLRRLKQANQTPPIEIGPLYKDAFEEAYKFLKEDSLEFDESAFTPEALLKSLKAPIDLKERLEKIRKLTSYCKSDLTEEKQLLIRIENFEKNAGLLNPQSIVEALEFLGIVSGPDIKKPNALCKEIKERPY